MATKKKQCETNCTASMSGLRKGDLVMVIAGGNKNKRPNKGKVGKIMMFAGEKHDRVVVEGVNVMVRHTRQTAPGKPSGKISREMPIHVSNVLFYAEKIKRPVRLKFRTLEDGKKVRGYTDPKSKEFVQI